jgi:hypothetical protein
LKNIRCKIHSFQVQDEFDPVIKDLSDTVSRHFISKGSLMVTLVKKQEKRRECHLFNDLLLVSKPFSGMKNHFSHKLMLLQRLPITADTNMPECSSALEWQVTLPEYGTIAFKASAPHERTQWVQHFEQAIEYARGRNQKAIQHGTPDVKQDDGRPKSAHEIHTEKMRKRQEYKARQKRIDETKKRSTQVAPPQHHNEFTLFLNMEKSRLHMELNDSFGRVLIAGFIAGDDGPGVVERDGRVKKGDFLVGVNDARFDDLDYKGSINTIKTATWPLTLHFLRVTNEPVGSQPPPSSHTRSTSHSMFARGGSKSSANLGAAAQSTKVPISSHSRASSERFMSSTKRTGRTASGEFGSASGGAGWTSMLKRFGGSSHNMANTAAASHKEAHSSWDVFHKPSAKERTSSQGSLSSGSIMSVSAGDDMIMTTNEGFIGHPTQRPASAMPNVRQRSESSPHASQPRMKLSTASSNEEGYHHSPIKNAGRRRHLYHRRQHRRHRRRQHRRHLLQRRCRRFFIFTIIIIVI